MSQAFRPSIFSYGGWVYVSRSWEFDRVDSWELCMSWIDSETRSESWIDEDEEPEEEQGMDLILRDLVEGIKNE